MDIRQHVKYSLSSYIMDTSNESDSLRLTQLIVNVLIDGLLCILGYIGNTLVLVVTCRDRNKNSHTVLLQALAVFDILFLVHTLLYTVLRSVYPTTGHMGWYFAANDYIIAIDLPFGWIAQTGTIWITMLLALDRYIAISRPFKAMVLCSVRNAHKAIIVTTVVAVLFNVVRFPHYYLVAMYSDSNSTFIAHIKTTLPGWNSDIYHYLYHISLTLIFLFLIPLTSLTAFNACLIRALRTAHKRRMSMSTSVHGNSFTGAGATLPNIIIIFNVVIVITKFIICETPDFIASVLGAVPYIATSDLFVIFSCIKEMVLVFNSAVNFYIYLMCNARFRKQLLAAVPCLRRCLCCAKRQLQRHGTVTSSLCSRVMERSHCHQTYQVNDFVNDTQLSEHQGVHYTVYQSGHYSEHQV